MICHVRGCSSVGGTAFLSLLHMSLREDYMHPSATVRIVVSDLGDEPIQELSPWLPQLPVAEGPMVAVEIISIARQN